jgi:hypothetical protein
MKTEELYSSSEESPAPAAVERKPGKGLRGLVEKYWSAPREARSEHRAFEILPDGNFDLVFLLGDSSFYTLVLIDYEKSLFLSNTKTSESERKDGSIGHFGVIVTEQLNFL